MVQYISSVLMKTVTQYSDMDFQTFHLYNRLVRRGLVKPLVCRHCDDPYVLRESEQGDPVLQCFACDALVQPGLTTWNNVRAVVKEHFDI